MRKKLNLILIFALVPTSQVELLAQEKQWITIINSETEFSEKQKKVFRLTGNSDFTSIEYAEMFHDIGNKLYFNEWYDSNNPVFLDSAISLTDKAVKLKLDLPTTETNSLAKSMYNLAYFQFEKEQYFDAIDSHLELLEYAKNSNKAKFSLLELGLLYNLIGDYENSILFYEKFLENALIEEVDPYWKLAVNLRLSETYFQMDYLKFTDKISFHLMNAKNLFYENIDDWALLNYEMNLLQSNLNILLGNYDLALINLEKGKIFSELLPDYHKPPLYNSLGVTIEKLGDSTLGVLNLLKAISLNSNFSLPYENLGDLYSTRNHFKEGLNNYQKAIYLASNQELNEDVTALPKIEDLKIAIEKKYLLGHLIQKANAWLDYYKHDGNQEYLNHALTTFERADELIDIIRSQSTEYQSKLYWRGQSSKLYMKAVEVSLLLDKPEKAYYFMERNKALLLLEDITHEKAKELSQLPESIAKREFELKRAIHLAENTLQNSASASQDSVQNLKNKIFQYKRNYEKYMDSLTIAFPDYARLKQQFQVLPYQDFRSNFSSEETATLQFILNDEQGYALLHANDKPLFYELEHTGVLNKNLLKFYTGLSSFNKNIEETNLVSNAIFKTLLPTQVFEAIKDKELIIVPDYNLQKIPFEALVTDVNDRSYLLENTELRYAYSLSYLVAKRQVQTQAEEDLLALAPVDFENLGLAKLGFSGLEVDGLKSIFGGETWLNEEASKENLLKNLNKHGILHFATHADIDDNGNHWVAFSDDKLYLNEIYATRNQAEMVVLSACNTSRGELKNGEGVMSLARAFFNSGAKSVVSSLWPTTDKTSKDIMIDFYQGLEEGLPKATALRNAKLNYLKAKPEASPAQWAALIVIGDNAPVKKPNFIGNNWPWMALAGGLLMIPVFLWRRRHKNVA